MSKKKNDYYKYKNYWGRDYLNYWKERTFEAENKTSSQSKLVSLDNKTPDTFFYYELIDLLKINSKDDVLEAGCGLGRSVLYLSEKCRALVCIDISDSMISSAQLEYGELQNTSFFVSAVEETQFESGKFDKIVCYGVFESVIQYHALIELSRLLKVGGRLLLTGKNFSYLEDDDEARIAEVNARKKGHPNYFTHFNKMVALVEDLGFTVKFNRFYVYRSDMAQNNYLIIKPNEFYYFSVVLEKEGEYSKGIMRDRADEIASPRSKFFT